jgi:hypothetical protein
MTATNVWSPRPEHDARGETAGAGLLPAGLAEWAALRAVPVAAPFPLLVALLSEALWEPLSEALSGALSGALSEPLSEAGEGGLCLSQQL